MSPFKVPEPVRAFLLETPGRAIIRDPSGTIVGFFSPVEANQPKWNGQAMRSIDRQVQGAIGGVEPHAILRRAPEPVQLCDEAGHVFGYFAPVPPERTEFVASAFPPPDPSKTEEDLLAEMHADFDMAAVEQERARNEKRYTLAEVYEHILSITPEPYWRGYLQAQIDRLKERDRRDIP
jgi:hypothetical protein